MKKLVIPFAVVVLGVAVTWWQPFSSHSPVNPGADSPDAQGQARFLGTDSLDRPQGRARFLDAGSLDRPETGFVDAASRQRGAGSVGGNYRQRRFGASSRPAAPGSATGEYFAAQSGDRPDWPVRLQPARVRRAANGTEERQQILPNSALAAYFGTSTTNAPQPDQQIQPGSMLDEYFYPDAEPGSAHSPPSGVEQTIQPGSMMSDYFDKRSLNNN